MGLSTNPVAGVQRPGVKSDDAKKRDAQEKPPPGDNEQVKENKELRDRAVAAEISAKAFKDRITALEEALAGMARQSEIERKSWTKDWRVVTLDRTGAMVPSTWVAVTESPRR